MSKLIKYTELYDNYLYKSYSIEINNYKELLNFLRNVQATLQFEIDDSVLIEDLVLYMKLRGLSKYIITFKEKIEDDYQKLKCFSNNFNNLQNTIKNMNTQFNFFNGFSSFFGIPQDTIDNLNDILEVYIFAINFINKLLILKN